MTDKRTMGEISHTHPNDETTRNQQSVFDRGGELTVADVEE